MRRGPGDEAVVFRGGVNLPQPQRRFLKRLNATIPLGRLRVSRETVRFWIVGMARTTLPPDLRRPLEVQRQDVRAAARGFFVGRGVVFTFGDQKAYFWTLRPARVLRVLREYGYAVD